MPSPVSVSGVNCPHCGAAGVAGRKFCTRCGQPLAAAEPTAPRRTASSALREGLSKWWIIVPTAAFAFLSRKPVPILVVGALGFVLWMAKSWRIPETQPPAVRALQPYLGFAPSLQLAVVFVMLGGSLGALALILAAVAAAVWLHRPLIAALEPWWRMQNQIPKGARKPLAFTIAMIIGFYFGINALNKEWTYTLFSLSIGAAIGFLLIFTPPDSLRSGRRP